MAEQVQGDQQYPDMNYATGQAWYQMYPELLNSINGGRAQRATTGLGTLGYLTNLITSPTSGPLGLAATASYGGPQGILAGTGGKGMDNSSQMSRYNTLLDNMLGYANDVNKHAADIPTADPNNAPGPTPENAAKAPTTADQWTAAFKAYHQGMTPEQWNDPKAKAMIQAWNAYHPGQPYQGAQNGGIIRAVGGARIGQPIPNAPSGDGEVPYTGPMPNAPARGDVANGLGVLGDAAKHFVDLKMGTADQFWANVQKVGRFQHFIDSLESGPGETAQKRSEQQGRLDKITGPMMGAPGSKLDLGSGAVNQDMIVEMLRQFSGKGGGPEFMKDGGRLPGYTDGGLQMLANSGLDSPEKVQQALAASRSQQGGGGNAAGGGGDRRMNAINEFGQSPLARSAMQFASGGLEGTFGGAAGDNGLAHGGYQIRTDAHPQISVANAEDPWEATKFMSNDYNLAAERVQRENPGLAESDPAKANALVAYYAENPTAMYSENRYRTLWDQMFPRKAAGGGVTLAGQPHWIVDDSGKPVAEITEDGSPEHVRGLKNGGVEVTPLRPDRYQKYTGRAAGDSQWTQMLAGLQSEVNRMDNGIPKAATGQQWLFPEIPNSMVNSGGPGGSNEIPTTGGPTSAIQTGTGFGAGQKPKSIDDLMNMTKTPAGGNLIEQFTRMMGGALGTRYTNMGDQVASMNQGKVNPGLMSSQQMATMSPTERAQYTALLQQMGVIGGPEDLNDQIKKFTPDGLG